MPTIYKRNFDDFPFFPGDYNIGEGNTIYDLRTIVIRNVSQFFIVKYTITIRCRMVHSEYISQQRNHSRYKYPVLGRDRSYFVKKKKKKKRRKLRSDSTQKSSETDIIKMLEFFLLTTH
jgi:hypothetical protein